jgi:hypothetical protein
VWWCLNPAAPWPEAGASRTVSAGDSEAAANGRGWILALWPRIFVGGAALVILGGGVSALALTNITPTTRTPPPTAQTSVALPFNVFSDTVLPDVAPATCELSSNGSSVVAKGTFDAAGTVPPNPNGNGLYSLEVGVLDVQQTHFDKNSVQVTTAEIAGHEKWQLSVGLSTGYTAGACYVGLYDPA